MGNLDIKICDACGSVPESMARVPAKNKYWPRTYTSGSYNYQNSNKSADLCPDCAKEFNKFMSGAQKAQEKVAKALEKCGYTKPKTAERKAKKK